MTKAGPVLISAHRALTTASPSTATVHRLGSSCHRRGYATPLNKRSSLEPALGTAPPPPPASADSDPWTSSAPYDSQDARRERWLNEVAGAAARLKANRSRDHNIGQRYPANLQRAKEALIKAPSKPIPSAKAARGPSEEHRPPLREHVLKAARMLGLSAGSTSTPSATPTDPLSATVEHLRDLYTARAGRQLSIELPYESTPGPDRRVPGTSDTPSPATAEDIDDGVLLLAYVSNLHPDRPGAGKLSLCSAFPIAINATDLDAAEDEPQGHGPLVISCAHTLTSALGESSQQSNSESPSSAALAMTRSGQVYAVRTLLSSVPGSDLILLQLSEQPVLGASTSPVKLRTLPLSPYPAHPGETILVSSFDGWDAPPLAVETEKKFPGGAYDAADGRGLERENGGATVRSQESRWGRARILEYKDGAGREARAGTYDDLHQLDFRLVSAPEHDRPKIAGVTVPMPTFVEDAQVEEAQSVNVGANDAESYAPVGFFTSHSMPRDGMQMLQRTLARLSKPVESQQRQAPTEPLAASPKRAPSMNRAFPPPGSSGGPIVSVRDGCVVGVVRGSRTSVLEGHRGDGVPAEKIYEMFSLPGLGKKKLEARKKAAAATNKQAGWSR
ncbi:hypothetical protein V8E36_006496 [Tilletia maclaganii]